MKRKVIDFLATGFYLGKIPKAPGTWGTLLGIPCVLALQFAGPMGYMLGALVLLFAAVGVAEVYELQTGSHDSGEFVLDEVVGYVIAMTWLPANWLVLVAAFLVFRVFDILKPYPINVMDQKIPGGFGTVLDDAAAGLLSNLVLQIVYTQTHWLGVTWDGSSLG